MRSFLTLVLFLLLTALIAFNIWRWPAPRWQGQDLVVEQTVGDRFEILFVGDTGTGGEAQMAVAAAMEKYCEAHLPIAVVMLGDNFYQKGVQSPEDPQWQSAFLRPYGTPCLGRLPFYALLGNHDYKGNPAAEVAFHSQTPRWVMPHRFYEVRFGQRLQIVALDTNILDVCGLASYCTLDFLKQAIAHRDRRTSIVVGHHPLSSSSEKYQDTTFQSRVLETLLCEKVPIYIAGHAHQLEHRRGQLCELDEMISGGGGAELYAVRKQDSGSLFARSTHGFLSVRVDPDALYFDFYNQNLDRLYSYMRPEPGQGTP